MKHSIKWQGSMPNTGLKKLFNHLSFAVISIFLISSIFSSGLGKAYALSPESNGDNSLQIVIEPSNDSASMDNKGIDSSPSEKNNGNYPDLGDDQVFPFAAGLDSY